MSCRGDGSGSARSRVTRALVGASVAVAANVAAGRALSRHGFDGERWLSDRFTSRRSAAGIRLGLAASWLTDVPRAIAITVGVVAATAVTTRDARRSALPGVATALASAMHVATSLLVGRDRPGGQRLGTEQITSSYPSGHVSAATALAMIVAGQVSERSVVPRRAARIVGLVVALLVGWSRISTGQHHATDVLAGYVNGAVAAVLAKHALRG